MSNQGFDPAGTGRRLLLKLITGAMAGAVLASPIAGASTAPTEEARQIAALAPHAKSVMAKIDSLDPNAPQMLGTSILNMRIGETVNLLSQTNLKSPLSLSISRDENNSGDMEEFYLVTLSTADGKVVAQVSLANGSTATFVKQQLQVAISADA